MPDYTTLRPRAHGWFRRQRLIAWLLRHREAVLAGEIVRGGW